jgi:hypothetical protein
VKNGIDILMFVQLFRFPYGLKISDDFIIAGLFKNAQLAG